MIHPTAYIDPSAEVDETCSVGAGSKVWGHATLMRGTVVGRNTQIARYAHLDGAVIGDECKVQNGAYFPPGVTVEDRVFVGPNACFTNHRLPQAVREEPFVPEPTRVCFDAVICANATIGPGITIGRGAFIAAGATVIRDVPDGATVYGGHSICIRKESWAVRRHIDRRDWQDVKPDECGEL